MITDILRDIENEIHAMKSDKRVSFSQLSYADESYQVTIPAHGTVDVSIIYHPSVSGIAPICDFGVDPTGLALPDGNITLWSVLWSVNSDMSLNCVARFMNLSAGDIMVSVSGVGFNVGSIDFGYNVI